MIQQVYDFMREHQMAEAGDRILVGVSGGADSTCLLCVLTELEKKLDLQLEVLHVNHGIRGERAQRDAEFVEAFCRERRIPFHLACADVPALAREEHLSLEAAARKARYEALAEWKERTGADRIAVAHHREDAVETFLLNLLRGSGLEGLSGIRPVRGDVIRPLLCVSRAEILQYLAEKGQEYCTDETNAENDAARNRLRNQVLPFLREEINAAADGHIFSASEKICEANAYLRRQAGQAMLSCAGIGDREVRIDAERACREDPLILKYMLRLAVEECKGDARDLTERHMQSMLRLFEKGEARRIDLPGTLSARREGTEVILGFGEREESKAAPPLMQLRMRTFFYDSSEKIPENRYTKWFDYDKIKRCVAVRHRQEGDYLCIAPSGRKTLRRFFIDQKIPRGERDACTLVADGNHILWIVGYRISEAYKITEKTKIVLEISAPEAEQDADTKEKKDERED